MGGEHAASGGVAAPPTTGILAVRYRPETKSRVDLLAAVGSKGRPYRRLEVCGFEILVGKGDAENDRLTFEVAEPYDWWLHVAGYSGSHVVVRNPEELAELPRPVLLKAAEVAAWHSKARSAGRVEVHVCRVGDVSKSRGFEPGKVQLRRWQRVRVYPRDPSAEPAE
jgi:predicted ribosome quality control (RQC) complex YloA/Tae2 family protein